MILSTDGRWPVVKYEVTCLQYIMIPPWDSDLLWWVLISVSDCSSRPRCQKCSCWRKPCLQSDRLRHGEGCSPGRNLPTEILGKTKLLSRNAFRNVCGQIAGHNTTQCAGVQLAETTLSSESRRLFRESRAPRLLWTITDWFRWVTDQYCLLYTLLNNWHTFIYSLEHQPAFLAGFSFGYFDQSDFSSAAMFYCPMTITAGHARARKGNSMRLCSFQGRLPVKWTAFEALLYGIHSTKSDMWGFQNTPEPLPCRKLMFSRTRWITNTLLFSSWSWSFGVVLHEIFTIGKLMPINPEAV